VPVYRVLYLKEQALIDRFRSQPPPSGAGSIKAKDYELVAEIEAAHEFAVWKALQGSAASDRHLRPMGVGDVLELEPGKPRLLRFSGFDDAVWFTFEPKKKDVGEASATPDPAAPSPPSDGATPDIQPGPQQ
jgi:hypothetical protein